MRARHVSLQHMADRRTIDEGRAQFRFGQTLHRFVSVGLYLRLYFTLNLLSPARFLQVLCTCHGLEGLWSNISRLIDVPHILIYIIVILYWQKNTALMIFEIWFLSPTYSSLHCVLCLFFAPRSISPLVYYSGYLCIGWNLWCREGGAALIQSMKNWQMWQFPLIGRLNSSIEEAVTLAPQTLSLPCTLLSRAILSHFIR